MNFKNEIQSKKHVYFMPGMAANSKIFEYIKLPKEDFQIHYLNWLIPTKNESLVNYSKRIIGLINHANPILVGVSFGGILVQEISKQIPVEKVIVVSSILNHNQLPKKLKFLRYTKTYHLIPTRWVSNIEFLSKYVFGDNFVKKRIDLYNKYLSVNDKRYLDWAIKEIVCWKQETTLNNVILIHGDKDIVFPYSITENTIVVKGGTHIMIINKYKWFNKNLPKLILK